MSAADDDMHDMTPDLCPDDLDDRRIEALLRGTGTSDEPQLTALLATARALREVPAPTPTPPRSLPCGPSRLRARPA